MPSETLCYNDKICCVYENVRRVMRFGDYKHYYRKQVYYVDRYYKNGKYYHLRWNKKGLIQFWGFKLSKDENILLNYIKDGKIKLPDKVGIKTKEDGKMDLQKQKRANELMEKIEKKEKLIEKVKEADVNYGLNAEIYKETLAKAKQVVVDRLELEKQKMIDEFTAL